MRDPEEVAQNNLENFLIILKKSELKEVTRGIIIFPQDRDINLNDFMKGIKKIVENFLFAKQSFIVCEEILKDFSFSRIMFKKCNDFLHMFFETR